MKSAYPQRMQTLLLDAARVFTLAKGVRGRSLPLCSLTIWYCRYALTLCIAKPDPAYASHSELNTSLRTTTRNQNSEPTKSIRTSLEFLLYSKIKLIWIKFEPFPFCEIHRSHCMCVGGRSALQVLQESSI